MDRLSQTQQDCQKYTPDVHTVVGDVSQEKVCRDLVETAVKEYGGVDIVIINAALTPSPPQTFVEMENPVILGTSCVLRTCLELMAVFLCRLSC